MLMVSQFLFRSELWNYMIITSGEPGMFILFSVSCFEWLIHFHDHRRVRNNDCYRFQFKWSWPSICFSSRSRDTWNIETCLLLSCFFCVFFLYIFLWECFMNMFCLPTCNRWLCTRQSGTGTNWGASLRRSSCKLTASSGESCGLLATRWWVENVFFILSGNIAHGELNYRNFVFQSRAGVASKRWVECVGGSTSTQIPTWTVKKSGILFLGELTLFQRQDTEGYGVSMKIILQISAKRCHLLSLQVLGWISV